MKPRLCGGAIFETREGDHIFQLREDKPGISLPGKVHVFGGGAEGDEDGRQAMIRELVEETGIDAKKLKAASLICTLLEPNDIGEGDNLVEVYLITGIQADEIEVLEGAGHVVINEKSDMSLHDFSETARHVLKLLGRPIK